MKHKIVTKHKKQKRLADKIIYFAAIIEPLFVIPQIIQIFRLQDATSVSLLTWLGFNVLTAIWLWWAILNREKVIIVYQGLYLVFNTVVIFGAFMFGAHWV